MNWRKGFLRIWFLLSVIWIGVVGIFSYEGIVTPYYSSEYGVIFRQGKPQRIEKHSEEYRLAEESRNRGLLNVYKIDELPGLDIFINTNTTKENLGKQIDEVMNLSRKVKSLVITKKRSKAIKSAWLLAFIPPVILFIAGFGFAWVMSGFRRSD